MSPEVTLLANYHDMSGFCVCAVAIIEALRMMRIQMYRHLSKLPLIKIHMVCGINTLVSTIYNNWLFGFHQDQTLEGQQY